MAYPNQVQEFIKVRLEQTPNNTTIARDVRNKFGLDQELDAIRRSISKMRHRWNIEAKQMPIKRLFFDIEKSHFLVKTFQVGKVRWINFNQIVKHSEVICISYKWQYEDEVHSLDWRMGQRKMLKEFVKVMGQADELVGHNIDNYDIKELRTACVAHGVLMFPNYRTLDTLKKSRSFFRFSSNKLDYISKHLTGEGKMEHEGEELWFKVEEGDEQALERMIQYCETDVIRNEDAFHILSPFITHNNNFAVLTGGSKFDCPECGSDNVEMYRTYSTPTGIIKRNMKCSNCKKQYRISNRNYMSYLEAQMRSDVV